MPLELAFVSTCIDTKVSISTAHACKRCIYIYIQYLHVIMRCRSNGLSLKSFKHARM